MTKAVLSCGALLVLSTTAAFAAAGLNLRWIDCLGDGGVLNRDFACNANSGNHVLAASLVLPKDLPQAAAVGLQIDPSTAGASLPEWWKFFNPGYCRQTSLSIAALDGSNCPDWALGQASVGIAGFNEGAVGGPNTAVINIANAVSLDLVQDLVAGQEYGVVKLTISNAKTAGSPSCAGCAVPACIIFQSADMFSAVNNGALHILMDGPANGTDSNFVTWQGGTGVTVGGKSSCRESVPMRKSSWGAVKALYR